MSSNLRMVVLAIMVVIVAVMWTMTWMSKRFESVASGIAALDARRFERHEAVPVGTGGTFENHQRSGPAIALGQGEDLVLIDAGRGVAEALRAARIPAWQPSHVVLTGLRPENTLGLDDLWVMGWLGRRDAPLRLYGPPGTRALVEGLRAAHRNAAEDMAARWELDPQGGETPVVEIDDALDLMVGEMRISLRAFGEGRDAHLGVRAEAGDDSLAILTRGGDVDQLAAFAQGVDWLWSAALYGASLAAAEEAGADHLETLRAEAATHVRLEDVGDLAARSRARGLVLIRLRPPPVFSSQYRSLVGETYRGAVVIPEDGDEIQF